MHFQLTYPLLVMSLKLTTNFFTAEVTFRYTLYEIRAVNSEEERIMIQWKFEKTWGGNDNWYTKSKRWANKQKFPVNHLGF